MPTTKRFAIAGMALLAGWALAPAQVLSKEFTTKGRSAILIDVSSKSVLFEKDADKPLPPASMSKLMTMAVIFKALKEGQIKLDDEYFVSENAWRTGGAPSGTSAMFAPLNSQVTLSDLIQGIAVQSGNDACIIVAEGMRGDEEAFAQLMTEYGRKLGLQNSTFRNSTGLPAPGHEMSARDLGKLANHLISEYPEYYHYLAQREFKYRKHNFYNRNPLLSQKIGVDGLKTGYTEESGYGMVASAIRDGRRLILVVTGLTSKKERKREVRRILNWGFRAFRQWHLFDKDEIVGEALVWGGDKRYVSLVGQEGVSIWLPRSVSRKIRASIVYNGPLKPPIQKGDQVATLRIIASNSAKTEVPLYAAEDIKEGPTWSRGVDALLHLAFGWLL